MSKAVILIPARYESTRFPGKPLSKILGKPMILHVCENMAKSGFDVAVVTDNDEIERTVSENGFRVLRIDDDVPSGSERIALALDRYLENQYEFVINVQGDEPLLSGDDIKNLYDFHVKQDEFEIATLYRKCTDDRIKSSDIVKIALSEKTGQCLYFSRSEIPFVRDGSREFWLQHIGVYSYRARALKDFSKLAMTQLEDSEKLEQLRALENGMKIGAIESKTQLFGVDRPEDITMVEAILKERQ